MLEIVPYGALKWGRIYSVHEMSPHELSCGIQDFSGQRVVTCMLTFSLMAEVMEVHFSVDGKLIYCNFTLI